MRWTFLIVGCLLLANFAKAEIPGIIELRKLYYKAPTDRAAADEFLQVMERKVNDNDPLMMCYKGMAHMIKANYTYNPYSRWAFFNKGRTLLERAVRLDPANVEIRFMRFCVQTNVPFFLGYSSEITADKAVILGSWCNLADIDLVNRMKNYLLQSKYCCESDRTIIMKSCL